MFGLNPLRLESFQTNVFKAMLLVMFLLFTCGLVTAVAVRFLDSTQTTPTELSQSLQPERLLGSDITFKVYISHHRSLKSFFKTHFKQFEDKCSDLRQRLRQASQNKGRHYANVYYLSGDRCEWSIGKIKLSNDIYAATKGKY